MVDPEVTLFSRSRSGSVKVIAFFLSWVWIGVVALPMCIKHQWTNLIDREIKGKYPDKIFGTTFRFEVTNLCRRQGTYEALMIFSLGKAHRQQFRHFTRKRSTQRNYWFGSFEAGKYFSWYILRSTWFGNMLAFKIWYWDMIIFLATVNTHIQRKLRKKCKIWKSICIWVAPHRKL